MSSRQAVTLPAAAGRNRRLPLVHFCLLTPIWERFEPSIHGTQSAALFNVSRDLLSFTAACRKPHFGKGWHLGTRHLADESRAPQPLRSGKSPCKRDQEPTTQQSAGDHSEGPEGWALARGSLGLPMRQTSTVCWLGLPAGAAHPPYGVCPRCPIPLPTPLA